jgi:hypothetical protein
MRSGEPQEVGRAEVRPFTTGRTIADFLMRWHEQWETVIRSNWGLPRRRDAVTLCH